MVHPLASAQYVFFTTFRKDGSPKGVPVYIVEIGEGKLGFTTSSNTWKAKRLKANPATELQVCDVRGNVEEGASTYSGTGVVETGAEFEQVAALLAKKYGFAAKLFALVYAVGRLFGKGSRTDSAIVITLDS